MDRKRWNYCAIKCGFSQKVILKQWFNDGERGYTDAYLMQRLFTSSV